MLYLAQTWPAVYWQGCCLQEDASVGEEHLDGTLSQDMWRLLLYQESADDTIVTWIWLLSLWNIVSLYFFAINHYFQALFVCKYLIYIK